MAELNPGDLAPDFTIESTDGTIRLSDLRGGKVLLTFYQEDNTPACATQLSSFGEDYEMLESLGARVVAISADDLHAHRSFAEQLGGVPFPLASDPNLAVAQEYGVVDETGKRSRRAAFVVDEDGRIAHAIPWYNPSNFQQYEEIFRALGMDV